MNRRRPETRSIWQTILKVVLSVCAVAAAVASGLFTYDFVRQQQYLILKNVQVDGNRKISNGEILDYASVPMGESLYRLNVDLIRRAVARHPDVASVIVTRMPPDSLRITVAEHRPVASVAVGHGVYLMNDEGKLFRRAQAGEELDLPVVTGIPRQWFTSEPQNAEKLMALAVEAMKAHERSGRPAGEIGAIDVDEAFGVTLHFGEPAREVALGRGSFDEKLRRLATLETHLKKQGIRADRFFLDNSRHPERVALHVKPAELAAAAEVAMQGNARAGH